VDTLYGYRMQDSSSDLVLPLSKFPPNEFLKLIFFVFLTQNHGNCKNI
jgi:hypothetical protein